MTDTDTGTGTDGDLSARLVEAAVARLRAGDPARALFDHVVGLAAEALPSDVWEAVAVTDVDADVGMVAAWLVRQLEVRPPPDDLSGLRFALYEVRGMGPGRMEANMAMSGGPGYPDPSWLTIRTWDPAGYAQAPGLRGLLPAAAEGSAEVRAVVADALVVAWALGVVADAVVAAGPGPVLGGRPRLGVAAGRSEAELVVVGELTPEGLDRAAG